ncbi:MAG: ribosomal RNA small subunit methyltransferase A [Candidatus Cloacimonadota bacterium]|nr:MAG: ribosomal RNA small subunit methyltransferase A [Candidatus Cloacimonadota bacterium]PIE77597.1 MAG: ribosomal RNA small subunit methyltransferase A [Candidatus Delongbacteria bacterium]
MIIAKKSLGQNFLKDRYYKKKIVESCNIKKGDFVVEIGPGMGDLTEILLNSEADLVTAIEIDKRLQEHLEEKFKGTKLNLIKNDFIKTNPDLYIPKNNSVKVVGNLPYHITSKIIFKIMDIIKEDIESEKIDSLTIMIQKEVALRLCAKHNNKAYGGITILTDLFCKKEILFDVPPEAFVPKPKVVSTVMQFKVLKNNPYFRRLKDYKTLKTLVKTVFLNRRKMLRNTLKAFVDPHLIKTVDITRRPETLTIGEFIDLANEIFIFMKSGGDS